MKDNDSKISILIDLAIENNLVTIEELTKIIKKHTNEGAVVENPMGPTMDIPQGPTVENSQGPIVANQMGNIIKNPEGPVIENPSEKEFDILEEERLRIERSQEEENKEYGSPGRSL